MALEPRSRADRSEVLPASDWYGRAYRAYCLSRFGRQQDIGFCPLGEHQRMRRLRAFRWRRHRRSSRGQNESPSRYAGSHRPMRTPEESTCRLACHRAGVPSDPCQMTRAKNSSPSCRLCAAGAQSTLALHRTSLALCHLRSSGQRFSRRALLYRNSLRISRYRPHWP